MLIWWFSCSFYRGYFEEIPICHPNVSKEAFELFDFMFTSGQGKLVNDPCTVMEVYTGIPFGGISSNPSKLVLDSLNLTSLFICCIIADTTSIKFYFKSRTKIKNLIYDYTLQEVVADIGGYTGLLMGVSAVNIAVHINKMIIKFISKMNIFSNDDWDWLSSPPR